MTVSDRDRKMLWALARNQCAICKIELVRAARGGSAPLVVGEECHIASPRGNVPRGTSDLLGAAPDSYENLILLCPSDHAVIDKAEEQYPPERLRRIKAEHEAWVKTSPNAIPAPLKIRRGAPAVLIEVEDGPQLLALVCGCHETSLDHEPLASQDEVDLVGGFLQLLFDTNDLWSEMEPAWRCQTGFGVDRHLDGLRDSGWRVFAARAHGQLVGGVEPQPTTWDTGYVRVVRANSPEIFRMDPASRESGVVSATK